MSNMIAYPTKCDSCETQECAGCPNWIDHTLTNEELEQILKQSY